MKQLRIHPDNKPLLDLPSDHPAHKAVRIHAECAYLCVGREILWPDSPDEPIEQTWYSECDQRTWSFSGFAYAFISFDLVLDGWLNEEKELDSFERDFLDELPRLRTLMDECQFAANRDGNDRVLPLIDKVREFFDSYEESILARVGRVHVRATPRLTESLWSTGRK